MILNKKLEKDIKEYCNLNNLKYSDFVNTLLKKAFLEEKYGKSPFNREKSYIIANENPKVEETLSASTVEEKKDNESVIEAEEPTNGTQSDYKLVINKKSKKRKLS